MTEQKLIYKQITAALKDIEAIGKNQQNIPQKFMFRGIEDVYNNLHGIFSKYKIFTVPEILEDKTEYKETREKKDRYGNIIPSNVLIYRLLKIKYTVYAEDGSYISGIVIGEAMDSGDKGANKAMSIAHKYFLTQLLCIPFQDMPDPDKETHDVKPTSKEPPKIDFEKIIKELEMADTIEILDKKCKDAGVYKHLMTVDMQGRIKGAYNFRKKELLKQQDNKAENINVEDI